MTDTALDPIEILRERIIVLENSLEEKCTAIFALEKEIADIRAWFAQRGHSYAGLAPQPKAVNNGDDHSNSVT